LLETITCAPVSSVGIFLTRRLRGGAAPRGLQTAGAARPLTLDSGLRPVRGRDSGLLTLDKG